MSSLNTISIIGNLGADPILRTGNGTPVCNLRVAVNEGTKDLPTTTWFNVSVWGEQAQALSLSLHKGMQVYATGKLTVNQWNREVIAPVSQETFMVQVDTFSITAEDVFSTENMNLNLDSVPVDNIPAEVSAVN
jgi:single stranded DNA-binding protein